jgi:hypothetical protein
MTRRSPRARPPVPVRWRAHARAPEVCPPVLIRPTRPRHLPLITRGSLLTTTGRGWTGHPHTPMRRLPAIQYT